MAWRTIVVTRRAKLFLKNRQLILKEEVEELAIPAEDIAVLVIESQQVNLTAALLSFLSENNVAVLFCDKMHLPNSILLSLTGNFKQAEVLEHQVKASLPLKKRIWQKIVRAKISNQAACLKSFGFAESRNLKKLIDKVDSGDPKNIEAQASRIYWKSLLGKDFKRGGEDRRNLLLNFGYSLLRSNVARAVVASGLSPSFGVHHSNKLNQFNLVDDLIEPFRPEVDRIVASMSFDFGETLAKEEKINLYELFSKQIKIGEKHFSLLRCTEVMTSSFVNALREGSPKNILLPEFVL